MPFLFTRTHARLGLAGAAGALLWAAQQPLDKRVARYPYDDVELLGRLVRPHGDGWRAAGLAVHTLNGAIFGVTYAELRRRTPGVPAHVSAQAMAQVENFGLFPLTKLLDRVHPARDRLPRLWGSRRALAQATWRHALLGLVLGEAARRMAR